MNAPVTIQLPTSVPFVPIMDRARFAELVGITQPTLENMIHRGYIPVITPSNGDERARRSFVNVAKIMADCMEAI